MDNNTYSVEVIKWPRQEDLNWVKTCALNTIGKRIVKEASAEWIEKLILAEHSPARELIFGIKMVIPYWVSVHFVRHHIGVNHYVQSQRDDRAKNDIPRSEKPQGELVSHIMSINAQELIFMAHKRLCNQASYETRKVMKMICKAIIKVAPYMEKALVPLCEYRNNLCTELYPCGKYLVDKDPVVQLKPVASTSQNTDDIFTRGAWSEITANGRVRNLLKRHGINDIQGLLELTRKDILNWRCSGGLTANFIQSTLMNYGFNLKAENDKK